jgi:PIN domain nuclease of toxin-antitoxin system
MKILLDTCAFLWIITDDPKLSLQARELFSDPAHDIYLSVVSVWEIAIKHSIGRLPLPKKPEHFIPAQRTRHGITSLALEEEDSLYLTRLPELHRDPFDRMLICQAIVNGMAILTPDESITRYPVRCTW